MNTETSVPVPDKKKSFRPSLLLILIFINLLLVFIILIKQSELTAIKNSINESNKTIADLVLNGMSNIESNSDGTNKSFAESMQTGLSGIQTKLDSSNKALAESMQNKLSNMQNGLVDVQSKINGLSSDLENIAPGLSNKQKAAEQAMSLAEQAWRNSDPALATIYVLNALNHNPANINCLQFYYNILENKRELEISDIDQFIDILDISVYQVSPGDVSKVLTMRNTLLSKQESMLNSAAAEVNRDASAEFAATQRALSNGRLSPTEINRGGKVNMDLLDERIETIATLISDADMSDSDRSSYMKLLNESSTFKLLATTLESAENAISKANSLSNSNSLTKEEILLARNQLQTANTYLSQIWTIDTTNFQAQYNVAKNLQSRIATIDKRLDVLASAPAKATIESKLAECRNPYGSYTSRINKISATLKEVAPLLAEVPDLDTRKHLESAMEEAAQQVEELAKSRYKAYQEWAVSVLNDAMNKYDKIKVFNDDDALQLFNEYHIIEINPSLLTYDVNSFYNSVYQIIYTELDGAKKKSDMQYNKATSSKVKQLEDF